MEFGTIERALYVDAAPETVFEVVSSPEHVKKWWSDEASYEVIPGAQGTITFGDPEHCGQVAALTVVESEPPRTFTFRWTHPVGDLATAGNSLLVTFELTPSGTGTLLRLTETGFREQGWEIAVLEQQYREHEDGWDYFLPRLAAHATSLAVGT